MQAADRDLGNPSHLFACPVIPILSHLTFYRNISFSGMFFYSYVSPFLHPKNKIWECVIIEHFKKVTFTTIFI